MSRWVERGSIADRAISRVMWRCWLHGLSCGEIASIWGVKPQKAFHRVNEAPRSTSLAGLVILYAKMAPKRWFNDVVPASSEIFLASAARRSAD